MLTKAVRQSVNESTVNNLASNSMTLSRFHIGKSDVQCADARSPTLDTVGGVFFVTERGILNVWRLRLTVGSAPAPIPIARISPWAPRAMSVNAVKALEYSSDPQLPSTADTTTPCEPDASRCRRRGAQGQSWPQANGVRRSTTPVGQKANSLIRPHPMMHHHCPSRLLAPTIK